MAASRSPLPFLKRSGLVPESLSPKPRLCPADFLVNTRPSASDVTLSVAELEKLEGQPPPDRNVSRPWPDENG